MKKLITILFILFGFVGYAQQQPIAPEHVNTDSISSFTDGENLKLIGRGSGGLDLEDSTLLINDGALSLVGAQNVELSVSTNDLLIQGGTIGTEFLVEIAAQDNDGTDDVALEIDVVGLQGGANREDLWMGWDSGNTQFEIRTESQGTGTARDLSFHTSGNSNQLFIDTDGEIYKNNAGTVADSVIATRGYVDSSGGGTPTDGSYTPALSTSGGGETVTYNTQSGYWQKSGDYIDVWVEIRLSSLSGGSGIYQISLPETAITHDTQGVVELRDCTWTGDQVCANITSGNAYVTLNQFSSGSASSTSFQTSLSSLNGSSKIWFHVKYKWQ